MLYIAYRRTTGLFIRSLLASLSKLLSNAKIRLLRVVEGSWTKKSQASELRTKLLFVDKSWSQMTFAKFTSDIVKLCPEKPGFDTRVV